MHSTVYHFLGVLKLVLFILLAYYVYCLRFAINNMDPQAITSSFKMVKILTYLLVLFILFLFLSKFFLTKKEDKLHHHHFCGIGYVNMALILMLYVFVKQTAKAVEVAGQSAVPVAYLDGKFCYVEQLAYALVGFNLISMATAYSVKVLYQEI